MCWIVRGSFVARLVLRWRRGRWFVTCLGAGVRARFAMLRLLWWLRRMLRLRGKRRRRGEGVEVEGGLICWLVGLKGWDLWVGLRRGKRRRMGGCCRRMRVSREQDWRRSVGFGLELGLDFERSWVLEEVGAGAGLRCCCVWCGRCGCGRRRPRSNPPRSAAPCRS